MQRLNVTFIIIDSEVCELILALSPQSFAWMRGKAYECLVLFNVSASSLPMKVQSAFTTIIDKLEESARLHLRRQLEANTSKFALEKLMCHLTDHQVAVADNEDHFQEHQLRRYSIEKQDTCYRLEDLNGASFTSIS
jgi:hypothetical protein